MVTVLSELFWIALNNTPTSNTLFRKSSNQAIPTSLYTHQRDKNICYCRFKTSDFIWGFLFCIKDNDAWNCSININLLSEPVYRRMGLCDIYRESLDANKWNSQNKFEHNKEEKDSYGYVLWWITGNAIKLCFDGWRRNAL